MARRSLSSASRSTPSREARAAFTLIELMAVLVILGMAAAIVVPMLGNTGDIDASAAARRMSSDLLYAQNYAITYQTTVRVTFNAQAKQYTLTAVPAVGAPVVLTHPVTKRPYVVGFNAIDGLSTVAISDTTFTNQTVDFDSLGSPTGAGDIVLSSAGVTRTVSVAAVTGKVSVR
ncbi:MAG: GspH/FimT family pseudopilin [Phycisphaerae bacterium]|nr:GspH/FimT family pseudopilin [Phycisphaerae bacterium]